MLNHETQPTSISILEGLRTQVTTRIEGFEETNKKVGREIREAIGTKVALIEKGVLPEFIYVDHTDISQFTGQKLTELLVLRYSTQFNKLELIGKAVEVGNRSERVIKRIQDTEWIQYGVPLIKALKVAVLRGSGRGAKK